MDHPYARLQALRHQAGWSQEELADKAHLTQSYIGRIERGERQPTIEVWARLARVLKVHLGALLFDNFPAAAPPARDTTGPPPETISLEDNHLRLTHRGEPITPAQLSRMLRLFDYLELEAAAWQEGQSALEDHEPGAVELAWIQRERHLETKVEALKDTILAEAGRQEGQAQTAQDTAQTESRSLTGSQQEKAQGRAAAAADQTAAWHQQGEDITRLKHIERDLMEASHSAREAASQPAHEVEPPEPTT